MILHLEALAAIALSLLMAGAWMVQQRTGKAESITSARRSTDSPISMRIAMRSKASSAASMARTPPCGCGAGAGSSSPAGLFGYAGGSEWGVSHYRMKTG